MIFVAAVLMIGAAIGVGKHEGVFDKGYDTTRAETIAFEKQAALNALEHIEQIEKKEAIETEQKKEEQVPQSTPQI